MEVPAVKVSSHMRVQSVEPEQRRAAEAEALRAMRGCAREAGAAQEDTRRRRTRLVRSPAISQSS